ncbi:hypothetical protein E4U32_007542 [Claviceps aff. humidiphila group G2b]|nr:hypothetical protein E4U32_007542 [Claviceps aff. humidiphila group G2b]
MTHLYQVRDSLRTGQDGYGCCRDCSSTLHEAFVKALDNVGLAGLSLDETFGHGSVRHVRDALLSLRLPPWSTFHHSNRIELEQTRKCDIHIMLQPVIERVWGELEGLRLKDYQAASKGGPGR